MSTSSQVQEFLAHQEAANKRRTWLHKLMRFIMWIAFRLEATGLENVPREGATVLMMNHMQFVDPVIATTLIRHRWVISMAKAETMDHWWSRFFVRLWGNFPIKRGEVDRAALTNTIELLNSGQLVLIAPEGTRNPEGLQQPKDGIAYILQKTDAVIVPCAVVGADNWRKRLLTLRRAYARVHFGRPFKLCPPEGQRVNRAVRSAMMREAMYQLALAIPDEYAQKRGQFQDVENATTQYIQFL